MPTTTRIVIEKPGSYDRLQVRSEPTPKPKAGEVQVQVHAIGVNYADVIVRMGLYASAKELVGWPITPGFEVTGTVAAVGDAVTDVEVGSRVMAVTQFNGYASTVIVPENQVFALPEDLSFEQGASIPAVFLTAHFALKSLANPRRGDHLLVHSAAGGVGGSLVQLGKLMGCTVTGVVGRSEKVPTAEAFGCDQVIDKSTENLWERAEQIAPKGFDIVLDANGVSTLGASYQHLARPGKLVVYGFAAMMPKTGGRPNYLKLAVDYLRTPRFNPLDMTQDSRSVLAFNLSYLFDRNDILVDAMRDIAGWLASGDIVPPPLVTYPLTDVASAHRDIESGRTVGKLILVP